jgi:hypothetical protein
MGLKFLVSEDPADWATKYQIPTDPIECHSCKTEFAPSRPIALKGYRGLMIPEHGCGDSGPFVVVPVGSEAEDWEAIRAGLPAPQAPGEGPTQNGFSNTQIRNEGK